MRLKIHLVFLLAIILAGSPYANAMCPERCTCDDVNLIVTCIKAGLEVMPNTLNPRLNTIIYKYNNIDFRMAPLPWSMAASSVRGSPAGLVDGINDGIVDGTTDGMSDGDMDGISEGLLDGTIDGI